MTILTEPAAAKPSKGNELLQKNIHRDQLKVHLKLQFHKAPINFSQLQPSLFHTMWKRPKLEHC